MSKSAAFDSRLGVEWLGRVAYADALAFQMQALEDRRAGATGDRLLLLEHPPVITLGRSTKPENLLETRESLARRGIEVHEVARGGDVTFHAPGQLVGYLIADLKARDAADVHIYLRNLESAAMETLERLGVPARRIDGMTGVFVDRARSDPAGAESGPERKIVSIGVGIRHWITYHGFALNADIDLGGFETIVPCGLSQIEMTSVARERHDDARDWMVEARTIASEVFCQQFA